MLQIVKELGAALTSEVDATRAKGSLPLSISVMSTRPTLTRGCSSGVELLSSVVFKMDKELLDRQMSEEASLAVLLAALQLTFLPLQPRP